MKDILNIIPIIHTTSLIEENVKASKKPKAKDIVKLGVKNIIGVNLIKIESDIISGL